MLPLKPGVFAGAFQPAAAGPWGVSARTLPTHRALPSVFETGLVAFG